MRLLSLAALLVCATTLLGACSQSDPKALTDQGTAALGSGDAGTAVQSFDAALAKMDASHPDYLRAQMGRCQALAQQNPMEGKQSFLDLARKHPDVLKEADFATIVRELLRKKATSEATEVVAAGMQRFPESPTMAAIRDQVGDEAAKSADPAAMDKLKGLGYAGSDE